MIDGVTIVPLKRIPDERGTIMHGVRRDTQLSEFGEVYFKKLYHGVVNGWQLRRPYERRPTFARSHC